MLKIAIVQHVIRWNELEWNLQHLTSLLDQRPGADLYVLAETFAALALVLNANSQFTFVQPPIELE